MANKKPQQLINYNSMSVQDFNSLIAGGNLEKPLYEFDANNNPIYHPENLQHYTPNVILSNPFTGTATTATGLLDYMKNQEKHQEAAKNLYGAFQKYNRAYNVDAGAIRAWKALGDFGGEAAITAGQTVGNIANAVHSVGRTMNESIWDGLMKLSSDRAKQEMLDILTPLGEESAIVYVKNHDFDNDTTISDEAKMLFKNYKRLLNSRDSDNLWSNTLQRTWEGARKNLREAVHQDKQGNTYQNLSKIAQFSGNIAGSLGVFKAAGIATNLTTKSAAIAANAAKAHKLGAALTKAYGVSGQTAVYGTSFFNQYDSLRRQGLAKGLSYDEANQMAFLGGLWESFVEGKGAAKFGRLSAKKSLMNVIVSETVPEAAEEMLQTAGEHVFTKIYGVNSSTFGDMVEDVILSGLGGALAGTAVGMVDYANGQSRTRIQASKEAYEQARQEAYEAAKARNPKLIENHQKQALEAREEENRINSLPAEEKAQEQAKIAEKMQAKAENATEQQILNLALPNEQRLLLERDEQYAQDLANADNKFREDLKTILSEKLKKANPKVSDEQIENASALLFRTAMRVQTNDSYGAAIDEWANDIVKWSNEESDNYQKNLADLDKRFGIDTLGLTPQDISDLKSGNRITRQNAEWKVVKGSIKTDFQQAGVSEKMADSLANTFEKVFASSALISNTSPTIIYEKLAPKILGLNRASINGQRINGYEGVLDNLPNSLKPTGGEQRIEAENIINSLAEQNTDEEALRNKELAIDSLTMGMDSKAGLTADDVLQALDTRATMEKALADEMGISYGNNFEFEDYRTMALMRARGASQEDINDAFMVAEREDADAEYDLAKSKLFPKLTREELKQTERILQRAQEERPDSQIRGVFAAPTADQISREAGKELEQAEPVGGAIVIGTENIDKVAAEEFFHAISTKMEEAAKIQAVKDSGKKFFAAYDIYTMGLMPESRPLAKLFNLLTQPINGIEMTDREKHETLATAFVNHVSMEIMPQQQKEYFNQYENENVDVLATAEDSKYENLSAEQKQALGERFANLLNPEASAELIAAGNQIANAGGVFDVMQAKQLAMDVLAKYDIYNGAQWAVMLSQIDGQNPADQLGLLQDFATNIIVQGYDLLVSDTYDLNYDEKQKQVLVRKAYKENSFLADDDPESLYFNSIAVPMKEQLAQYMPNKAWIKNIKDWAKKTFDFEKLAANYIETLSAAAFKADPIIGSTLRRAMFKDSERQIRLQKMASVIPLLIDKHGKNLGFSRKDFVDNFKNVLSIGDKGAREKAKNWIAKQFAATGDSELVAKTMDDIYNTLDALAEELHAKGVQFGDLKEYWPTYVEQRQELAEYLGYAAPKTQTGQMISDLVEKLKDKYKKASSDELRRIAIDTINRQWHKYSEGDQVAAFHQRGNYFNAETSEFYSDPFEALARYFEGASRTLLMRTLTGRVIPAENDGEASTNLDRAIEEYKNPERCGEFDDKETGVLGKAFALALSKKNPNWQALDNFARQMKRFVNRTSDQQSNFVRFWQRTNSFLLGTPFSAMNQFQELAITEHLFGLKVTNDAIQEAVEEILNDAEGTMGANLENINVQALQELIRYRENDFLSKATELAHTISGFKGADVLLKNIEIKAALKNAKEQLTVGDANDVRYQRFVRDFNKTFPAELYSDETRYQIMDDIRNNNMTENVKFFLFNYISDIQPINSAEVPAGYNAAGAIGRLVYQYRTTPLRQLEFVVNDNIWGFKNLPLKDAVMNLIGYLMYFMAIGVPIAALQALLRGKKPNLAEEALYSPFQLLMINEYTVNSIKQKGIFKGLTTELSPSFRVGDDISKDLIRLVSGKSYQGNSVKDVPIGGPLMYYWLLGGREHAKRHGEAIGYDPEDNQKYENSLRAIGGH